MRLYGIYVQRGCKEFWRKVSLSPSKAHKIYAVFQKKNGKDFFGSITCLEEQIDVPFTEYWEEMKKYLPFNIREMFTATELWEMFPDLMYRNSIARNNETTGI